MPAGRRPVRVWDLPTRLFHWLTVALVAGAWLTEHYNRLDWHVRIGEALLALVLFRVLWGCFGSETARFGSFVATPAAALRHLRGLFRRDDDRQVGHNAAGGWMVLLLLALLLLETLSGLYLYNDIEDDGPLTPFVPAALADAIDRMHALGWDLIVAAVALHVAAIVVYAVAKGHDLVRPMLTGRKPLPDTVRAPVFAPVVRAVLLLACAAALVAALATWL